jgi:uncharacterized protein YbjT (DUF2867 family)
MSSTIFVTGATGNVGREVVKALQAEGISCVVGGRNPERLMKEYPQGSSSNVEIRKFDFLDVSTFEGGFVGIKSLFLVRPPHLANVERDVRPALDVAVAQGVEHVVFLSIQGVDNAKMTPHYKLEQLIRSYKINFTFLRVGFFMQNLTTTHLNEIRDESVIAVPVGHAKTSFIDVRDIGAVGAQVLIDTKHRNRCYTLTGSAAFSYFEVANVLTQVLGRNIQYTNPNPISFFFRTWWQGQGIGFAFVVTALYTITRMGNAEDVSHDVAMILGRDPISFRQFAGDHRDLWLSLLNLK